MNQLLIKPHLDLTSDTSTQAFDIVPDLLFQLCKNETKSWFDVRIRDSAIVVTSSSYWPQEVNSSRGLLSRVEIES